MTTTLLCQSQIPKLRRSPWETVQYAWTAFTLTPHYILRQPKKLGREEIKDGLETQTMEREQA